MCLDARFEPLTRMVTCLCECLSLWHSGSRAFAHVPTASPWRRCAFTALLATRIVRYGFFLLRVKWQMVTFFAYCWLAAGVADGDTAAPTSARAAKTSTHAPAASPARKSLRDRGCLILRLQ